MVRGMGSRLSVPSSEGLLNEVCKIYLTMIRGTPVVIQLMIMYYIIFASSRNGVAIAILAFGINSGAYTAEIIKEDELNFEFTGQQAIDFLTESGQKPEYDENGNVEPVRFCMDELVALLPRNGAFADDADFQSPVLNVYSNKFLGQSFYSIDIMIGRDPDISVQLYAPKSYFESKPKKNDSIRGVMWLQGCLDDSHQE